MISSPILTPSAVKGWVSRDFALGVSSYEFNNPCSPETSCNQSIVANLICPKFEPNKTYIYDTSRYNNHGIITGATWGILQSGLRILNFNGDDFIDISSTLNQLTTATVGTWEGWFNLVDATPATQARLIAFGDTDGDERLVLSIQADGKLAMFCRVAGASKWSIASDAVALLDKQWFHIAVTQNGANPVMYINGVAIAQTNIITTDKTIWFSGMAGLDNGRIGCINNNNLGNAEFLIGAVGGNVRLHSRVLSAKELLAHYQTEKYIYR